MANIIGTPLWTDVYKIALTDDVLGDDGGVVNVQAKALTDRTEFLADNKADKSDTYTKAQVDSKDSVLQGNIDDNAADIAANLVKININTANISANISAINALDGRVDANETDILALESDVQGLDGRVDDLEDDTGWLNGSRVSSKVDVSTFNCKVKQVGSIVYVTGKMKFNSQPNINETLISFPASIGIPSVQWNFFSGDSANDKVNELHAYNGNRYIRANSADLAVGTNHVFGTSYPV